MTAEILIVAVDGPSGVGKTTIARRLAARLGVPFLETGAMYRAAAWKVLQAGVDPEAREDVEALVAKLDLELRESRDEKVEIRLDGELLDARIRAPEVSEATSVISTYPGVRREMVRRQREFAAHRGAVMEGRDIGTRVFPDTPHKFFLRAPLETRVDRRLRQLGRAGTAGLSRKEIEVEVADRDLRDSRRLESPLTLNASYTLVDTGELSVEEAVEAIIEALGRPRDRKSDLSEI